MIISKTFERNWIAAVILTVFLLIFPAISWAAEAKVSETQEAKKLKLVVGKSIVFKTTYKAKRVSIADPEIADFVLISPLEIYISGKAAGTTNLTVWQDKQIIDIYDLEVAYDILELKQKIHEILPNETDLSILATHNSITLSGRVSTTANLSQVIALAEAYAPKDKIKNFVEAGGVHQVMLEVRVAEMGRSMMKRLGVNFNYVSGQKFGVSTLGGLTQLVDPDDANIWTVDGNGVDAPAQFFVSQAVNALFRFNDGQASWTGFIDALKQDGLVKILAEPTLIAQSGHSANFLAGGEFPVPVPQGLGTVAINYKAFGVGLSFSPTVLSKDRISMKVAPEVSELDFTSAAQLQGFVVPGLSTRRAETVIELADGQSFAIAGLLRDNTRDAINKYPFLGDIPILGALFRSRAFQKNETELIIIATPHIVKPLDVPNQTLPTDYYKEPNDWEFYMLGLMEGNDENQPTTIKGELEGNFGHSMPQGVVDEKIGK